MSPTHPTDMELRILGVLWDEGPSTVGEIMDHLEDDGRSRAYTTYLKHLQLMHEKGLVDRDESSRAHVYSTAVLQDEVERGVVRDILDTAFGGSAAKLVMRALDVEGLTDGEREEIRALLADAEEEEG